jgi:hypothetical protein
MGGKIEHPWRIEQWDSAKQKVERTFAECTNLDVAIAAYEAAIAAYPDQFITMRAGAHVFRQNWPIKRANVQP